MQHEITRKIIMRNIPPPTDSGKPFKLPDPLNRCIRDKHYRLRPRFWMGVPAHGSAVESTGMHMTEPLALRAKQVDSLCMRSSFGKIKAARIAWISCRTLLQTAAAGYPPGISKDLSVAALPGKFMR